MGAAAVQLGSLWIALLCLTLAVLGPLPATPASAQQGTGPSSVAPVVIPTPQAQPEPAPLQTVNSVVTLRAHARAVLLDVVVTDGHGHAVHGLKAADFQLFEDGQPQTIASFEEHHPPTPEQRAKLPAAPPLGPNTWTNMKPPNLKSPQDASASIVLLLDALNSPPSTQAFVRSQLLSYVRTMQPGTQVAIFQLDTGLRMIQGFTADPEVLERAVKEREKTLLTPIPQTPGYVSQALRMDVLRAAMQSLGAYLQTRPGRKNLIWFTAHIPDSVYNSGSAVGGSLRDPENFIFDYTAATDALVLGQVSVYPVDARGLQTDPSFSAASRRGPTAGSTQAFNNAQFYQHADLDQVAEATGGKAFYNTNGLKQVVSEVAETGSSYYTLTFYPANKKWDGRFRKLKVDLDQSGTQLEYRRGYYAVSDASAARPPASPPGSPSDASAAGGRLQLTHHDQPSPFIQAMQLGAVDPGQIIFRAHAIAPAALEKLARDQPAPKDFTLEPRYRDKPFRNLQVDFMLLGDQLHFSDRAAGMHHGELQFVVLLLDEQGALVSSAKSTVEMNLKPETYRRALATGVEMPVQIAVPEKGAYFLRLGVHDTMDDRGGALEVSTGDIQIEAPKP